MTKCLPPSNYVTSNLHSSVAVFVPQYRPSHNQLGSEAPTSTHWLECCWALVKPCSDCLAERLLDLPEIMELTVGVPDLKGNCALRH